MNKEERLRYLRRLLKKYKDKTMWFAPLEILLCYDTVCIDGSRVIINRVDADPNGIDYKIPFKKLKKRFHVSNVKFETWEESEIYTHHSVEFDFHDNKKIPELIDFIFITFFDVNGKDIKPAANFDLNGRDIASAELDYASKGDVLESTRKRKKEERGSDSRVGGVLSLIFGIFSTLAIFTQIATSLLIWGILGIVFGIIQIRSKLTLFSIVGITLSFISLIYFIILFVI